MTTSTPVSKPFLAAVLTTVLVGAAAPCGESRASLLSEATGIHINLKHPGKAHISAPTQGPLKDVLNLQSSAVGIAADSVLRAKVIAEKEKAVKAATDAANREPDPRAAIEAMMDDIVEEIQTFGAMYDQWYGQYYWLSVAIKSITVLSAFLASAVLIFWTAAPARKWALVLSLISGVGQTTDGTFNIVNKCNVYKHVAADLKNKANECRVSLWTQKFQITTPISKEVMGTVMDTIVACTQSAYDIMKMDADLPESPITLPDLGATKS